MTRALFLAALALLAPAWAQDRRLVTTRQLWDGPSLVTWSVTARGVEVRRPGAKPASYVLPEGHRLMTVVSGTAWTVALQGEPRRPVVYRSADWSRWDHVGALDLPEARIRGLFPLKDDRFLLQQGMDPFVKEGRASFLAIARLKEGTLQVESLVELGLELVAPMPKGTDPAQWIPMPRPGWEEAFGELSTTALETVGGQPCLVAASLGKVFFFSPEHGGLKRTATLYAAAEELLAKGQKPAWPLILVRPLPSGELVVAARSEDAVRSGRRVFADAAPVERREGATPVEAFQAQQAAQAQVRDKVWEAYPELLWFRVNPEEGLFRALSAPAGLPDKLASVEDFERFTFKVQPGGDLAYGL
jgi:hypothetical protein